MTPPTGDPRGRVPGSALRAVDDSPLARGLQLFALFGVALASPVLDLLARNPGFLVAHRATPVEIATLAASLLLLPALVAWLAEGALGRLSRGAARALHLLLAGVLAAAFLAPALGRLPWLPGWLVLAASALGGVALSRGLARRRVVRGFVAFAGLLPLGAALAFFANDAIGRLMRPGPDARGAALELAQGPPLVVVIFDELPTTSLLDRHGEIDAELYPNFALLAEQATWFPHATTVGSSTNAAVPAILTGRYPRPGALANHRDHAINLFSWLAGSYAMRVQEARTHLYRPADAGAQSASGVAAGLGAVASDLWILYLHVLAPDDLSWLLPDVSGTWKSFGRDAPAVAGEGDRKRAGEGADRAQEFLRFVASIEACETPCLYFVHAMLPHRPWQYTPSGRRYFPVAVPGLHGEQWGEAEWWLVQGYQRHLLQLVFVDRLLGKLVGRLKQVGLYEPALIVVVADHGVSFWPGQSRRKLERTDHPEDLLRVPLLLKLPHQRAGAVVERPIETVDILPAIAAVLGAPLPEPVDGCSALDASCPERRTLTAFGDERRPIEVPLDLHSRSATLDWKFEHFGSATGIEALFRIGPYRELVGRKADTLEIAAAARLLFEVDATLWAQVRSRPERFAATRLAGRLVAGQRAGEAPYVAVATRGIIRAVVPVLRDRRGVPRFSALLPEASFRGDPRELELFAVGGSPERPQLNRARVRPRRS